MVWATKIEADIDALKAEIAMASTSFILLCASIAAVRLRLLGPTTLEPDVSKPSSSLHSDDTHRSAVCCIPSYLITSRALLVYDVLAFCVALRLTKSANG